MERFSICARVRALTPAEREGLWLSWSGLSGLGDRRERRHEIEGRPARFKGAEPERLFGAVIDDILQPPEQIGALAGKGFFARETVDRLAACGVC